MDVLCIGNSFSQDSTRYLHRIARAGGVLLNVCNLYVSGCTLAQHYQFMMADSAEYELEYNGELTKFMVSLKQALTNREWDYISFQQASHKCTDSESYEPYLTELHKFAKKCCPRFLTEGQCLKIILPIVKRFAVLIKFASNHSRTI